MDFRNITKIDLIDLSCFQILGDVVRIRSNDDILWAKQLSVDIKANPEDYGTIVITPTSDKYYYGQTISYRVNPKDSSKVFTSWQSGETTTQHSSITLSNHYSDIAYFQTEILSDYYDSEEFTQKSGQLYLKAGTYRVMVIGSGGGGGRSNRDMNQQGSFGGGSSAAISGYMNLTTKTHFTFYTATKQYQKDSWVKSGKNENDSDIYILADCGKNGRYGTEFSEWFHSFKGCGGKINNSSTKGMITADTTIWAGNDGTAENNGEIASGGNYATTLIKDHNLSCHGGGTNYGVGYKNLRPRGTSYNWTGYIHIERVYTVTFKGYKNNTYQTLASYKYIRRGTSVDEPDVPARTGYTHTGWSPAVGPIYDDTIFEAVYQTNSYTVIFKQPDTSPFTGAEISKVTVVYGTTLTYPNAPEIAGYTFGGWSNPVPSTAISNGLVVGSCTITAKYNKVEEVKTVLKLNIPNVTDCVLQLDTGDNNETLMELKE